MDKYSDFILIDSRDIGVKYLTKDGLKIYVMKIVPSEHYFNKEIEILKKLNKLVDFVPSVVDDFELSKNDIARLGIAMKSDTQRLKVLIYDYIDGQDLFDYTEDNILTARELNEISFQMLKIVHKIHGLGIFHRDIKLENFVIDTSGKVYLIDFGLSHQIQDDYVMTPMIPGSIIYVSREYVKMYKGMVVGKKYEKNKINAVLKSNDIYCLSITLYALYNDDFPYKDEIRYGDDNMFIKTLSNSKYKPKLHTSIPVSNPIIMDAINLSRESDYKSRILLWDSFSIYLE